MSAERESHPGGILMSAHQVSSQGSVGREYVRVGERRPTPATIDWASAPSTFKRYRGCATLPAAPLCGLLRDVYGLTRQQWNAPASEGKSTALRPVPAGGARFPCELYLVAGRDQPIPPGVYHYDAAHHWLDVLREGDFGEGLSLLVTVAFWKNVFKYGEFSYRLHSCDTGVVIGQSLAVLEHHGLRPTVRYQFSDAEYDRLLGLDPDYESVYAVIALSLDASIAGQPAPLGPPAAIPQPQVDQTQTIGLYPLPAKLHEMSMQQGASPWPLADDLPPVLAGAPASARSLPLPAVPLSLLDGLHHRRSSRGYFSPESLTRRQLAALLAASMPGYANDLDAGEKPATIRRTALFCAVNRVDGIEPGAYSYDPARHTLEQLRTSDIGAELHAAVTSLMFNLRHVSLCLFPVADYGTGLSAYGDRWYRVQNMEAGIVVQRLYLASAALGLGCRTQMGFHPDTVNRLLGLGDSPLTSLIHVLIGPDRNPGNSYEYAW